MLDIKIRVFTFVDNHSQYQTVMKYFMKAFCVNSGAYYSSMSFTIMFVNPLSIGLRNVLDSVACNNNIELCQVTPESIKTYQDYWPLSFMERDYNEDLLIYCPPNTLVVGDISSIIETAYSENKVLAPQCTCDLMAVSTEQVTMMLSMSFVCLPKTLCNQFKDSFPQAFVNLGVPKVGTPAYAEIMVVLYSAFNTILKDKEIPFQSIAESQFYEFCMRQNGSIRQLQGVNFDDVKLFSLTDEPGLRYIWRSVYVDEVALQEFLTDFELSGAMLYYQKELRKICALINRDNVLTMRSFFQTTRSPYYIYGLNFVQQSAGIRALHYLCHALNEGGQEAYITCENVSPLLRTPVLTEAVLMQHYAAGRKPIMVYPEIVSGDPMAAGGVVVRWLLNQAGHIGGDTAFAADDIIFAYDDLHLTQGMRGEILHIPTGNTAIFNNDDNPYDDARDLVCYYAHKYLYNGGQLTEQVQGAISLCKDQVLTHAEIAAILRRSKLLYVYESTSLIEEALLCGCPVSVIETDYWRNNMANYAYTGDIGVVMDDSPESIALATANVHKYRELHENVVVRDAWRQIDRFVEITQNAAKLKAQYS